MTRTIRSHLGLITCFLGIGRCFSSLAQETHSENVEDIFKVNYDTPLTLDLNTEETEKSEVEPIKHKKKKVKKNVFFGTKTRKGITRNLIRGQVVQEFFHIMKVYEAPPDYARDFYWYDYNKKKIVNSLRVSPKNAGILHGPYKKMIGEQVLEEGWFYKGMKHKRWIKLNRHDILQNKTYWWKGWPQESLLSYYDFEKTKLREVIPKHYGERNGEYWAFHLNGAVAVRGIYKHNHKIGIWKEYYENKKIKREMKYPSDAFHFEFRPYILKEWDPEGKVIFDYAKLKAN